MLSTNRSLFISKLGAASLLRSARLENLNHLHPPGNSLPKSRPIYESAPPALNKTCSTLSGSLSGMFLLKCKLVLAEPQQPLHLQTSDCATSSHPQTDEDSHGGADSLCSLPDFHTLRTWDRPHTTPTAERCCTLASASRDLPAACTCRQLPHKMQPAWVA